MQKFWNLVLPEEAEKPAELYLEGEIAAESWYGDEVTPEAVPRGTGGSQRA